MNIQRFDIGARMSQAVSYNGFVFTAGQVATASAGGSVKDQTTEILAKIDDLLARAGTDKTAILSATIWISDMGTFAEMNEVWDGWVPEGHTPARATVESKLAGPQYKVEIGVIAAVKS